MTAEDRVKRVHPKARYKNGVVSIPKPAIFWVPLTPVHRNERRAWADALRRIEAAQEKT